MLKPFFIRKDRLLKRINPMDVVGLSTEGNYTKILMANDTGHMVRSSLASALKKLPAGMFIRIHRSMAASVYYIDKIDRDHLIVDNAPNPFPIGKQYYQSLIDKLDIIE